MFLDPKLKTNYLKIFGIILMALGTYGLIDGIKALIDPCFVVVLNGMKRNDFEAKLTVILLPLLSIIAGIALTKISPNVIEKHHSIQRKFWDLFK